MRDEAPSSIEIAELGNEPSGIEKEGLSVESRLCSRVLLGELAVLEKPGGAGG